MQHSRFFSFLKGPRTVLGRLTWWQKSLPTVSQWNQFLQSLTPREKVLFFGFLTIFVVSAFYLLQSVYQSNTVPIPMQGGHLTEGLVGNPRAVNSVRGQGNDVDRDLLQLLYAGLFTYDEKGEIVPHLVKEYTVLNNGLTIELTLHDNLKWSDGEPLRADDVLFTIETIQNPSYNSFLRRNWVGVRVEKISDTNVRILLREPYAPILEQLTLQPIPKHIWNSIAPRDFDIPSYGNLKPVGNGPYRVADLSQDQRTGFITEMELEPNPYYHGTTPYMPGITLRFFADREGLVTAANRGTLDSFSLSPLQAPDSLLTRHKDIHAFPLPRYFAVFFNTQPEERNSVTGNSAVRNALVAAIDKEAIIKTVFGENGSVVNSPLLPEHFELSSPQEQQFDRASALSLLQEEGFIVRDGKIGSVPTQQRLTKDLKPEDTGSDVRLLQECLAKDPAIYSDGTISGYFGPKTRAAVKAFQEKYATEILEPTGLRAGTGTVGSSTRAKLNELCFTFKGEFVPLTLHLSALDEPTAVAVVKEVEKQWEELGIEVNVLLYSQREMSTEIIPSRDYEALFFGEVLTTIPDPFPFWHSSNARQPGLNLSLYESKAVDKLLEEMRVSSEPSARKEKAESIQEHLLNDAPAVFLFDTDYLYVTPKSLKGITEKLIPDPAHRFSGVEQWYLKTKRQWDL